MTAVPTAASKNSMKSRRRSSLTSFVEENPSFASKLPSVERGDVIDMDKSLETLLNGVSESSFTVCRFATRVKVLVDNRRGKFEG